MPVLRRRYHASQGKGENKPDYQGAGKCGASPRIGDIDMKARSAAGAARRNSDNPGQTGCDAASVPEPKNATRRQSTGVSPRQETALIPDAFAIPQRLPAQMG